MKGIYLASHIALHTNYDIDYQDITGLRDIGGDMLDIDLTFEPDNIQNKSTKNRQGGKQVYTVIERWLSNLKYKKRSFNNE